MRELKNRTPSLSEDSVLKLRSRAPWQVAAGGFEPVEVEILAEDEEKALKIIAEFNKAE